MRPKATLNDLPTTYNVKVYHYNQFVKHIQNLKGEITVRNLPPHKRSEVDIYLGRWLQGKFRSLWMGGQLTQQRQGFLA